MPAKRGHPGAGDVTLRCGITFAHDDVLPADGALWVPACAGTTTLTLITDR
jgi:hypothetical protein